MNPRAFMILDWAARWALSVSAPGTIKTMGPVLIPVASGEKVIVRKLCPYNLINS